MLSLHQIIAYCMLTFSWHGGKFYNSLTSRTHRKGLLYITFMLCNGVSCTIAMLTYCDSVNLIMPYVKPMLSCIKFMLWNVNRALSHVNSMLNVCKANVNKAFLDVN